MNKEKLLEELVIDYGGVWPKQRNVPLVYKGFHIYIPEFEQKAKEMGYVNGYRYGVEYKTNGKRPDLDGDIIVKADDDPSADEVESWEWCLVRSFRITDLRYKPADTSYLVERGMELVGQIQEKLESVTEKLEATEWYDYDNQKAITLPPVATEVIAKVHKEFNCYFVGKNSLGNLVIELANGEFSCFHAFQIDFKPFDWNRKAETEKDALIKEATDILYKHACATKGELIDGAKALYDAGYLVLPKKE
jgi:hypothetical protein